MERERHKIRRRMIGEYRRYAEKNNTVQCKYYTTFSPSQKDEEGRLRKLCRSKIRREETGVRESLRRSGDGNRISRRAKSYSIRVLEKNSIIIGAVQEMVMNETIYEYSSNWWEIGVRVGVSDKPEK